MPIDVVSDVDKLRDGLGPLPEPVVQPALVVVSGLPGSGKSFFSRRLAERLPSAVLESDMLRQRLFDSPTYTAEESARLFRACHNLIEELLQKGISIILDATNLSERNREVLYHIAEQLKARLVLVRVEAPVEVVKERLEARAARRRPVERSEDSARGEPAEGPSPEDHSQADWEVYRKMKSSVERIGRRHFAVDTSRDITPVIDKIMREVNR